VIILSHPTGNQNVRQAALALVEADLLREFWTCINWKSHALDRLLPKNIRQELRRRSFPDQLQSFIKTQPWREWGRLISGRLRITPATTDETGVFSMDAVYRALDRRIAKQVEDGRGVKAVYAFDGGALESFRAAKRAGAKCIYEQPIVYWRKVQALQREEAALQPQWASTLLALRDREETLARKEAELELADVIVTASSFARASLGERPELEAKARTILYGAPPISEEETPNKRPGEKLRVLFVGALTQAKGLGYLLEAVAPRRSRVALTLIGHRVSAEVPTAAMLDSHRWISSLPRPQLLAEMARHDVLAFPSLHEGFGLVILEAMAHGACVIATPNTGGADVIDHGTDGLVVPIRSAEAIGAAFDSLLKEPERLAAMKEAARAKAKALTWEVYRSRIAALAREVITT
jgi:starch synthase